MEWLRETRYAQWVRRFAVGMVAYLVIVVAAGFLLRATDPPEWARLLLAVAPALAAVYALGSQVRGLRAAGVERTHLVEATSYAFFLTALGSLTYGFFEAWAHAPKLSAFWVWGFAMGSWLAIALVLQRRFE